jgi:MADS-box transcription factor
MPSPLNFATPIVGSGPSFLRDDSGERANGKRKTPEQEGEGSGEENGGGKRVKPGSP